MTTFLAGVPRGVPKASTFFTTSIPSVTFPNTVCLPSTVQFVGTDEGREHIAVAGELGVSVCNGKKARKKWKKVTYAKGSPRW